MRHCNEMDSGILVIEATCNQVNQFGGYTGMQPLDFVNFVTSIANESGFDIKKLILGGDHLGPNPWRNMNAEDALCRAETMVKSYVQAGFRKIHIDCTMSCADDKSPLSDDLIARRTVRLIKTAEAASGTQKPLYVIGSEVPVPGGAHEALDTLTPTAIEAAKETIEKHRDIFKENDLDDAWKRVIALVVQPGVEFDNSQVFDFDPIKAKSLSLLIEDYDNMLFEAHSTDYQTQNALSQLVEGHFALLKVGPGLTFALREALWALDEIEAQWIGENNRAGLKNFVLDYMKSNPNHWMEYYGGSEHKTNLELQYSLSDRIRYYWPDKQIQERQESLFKNIDESFPPYGLLSQYLPLSFARLREKSIEINAKNLVMGHIMAILDMYYLACNPTNKTKNGGENECR